MNAHSKSAIVLLTRSPAWFRTSSVTVPTCVCASTSRIMLQAPSPSASSSVAVAVASLVPVRYRVIVVSPGLEGDIDGCPELCELRDLGLREVEIEERKIDPIENQAFRIEAGIPGPSVKVLAREG